MTEYREGDDYFDGEHRPNGETVTRAPFCRGRVGLFGCLHRTWDHTGYCWQHRPPADVEFGVRDA